MAHHVANDARRDLKVIDDIIWNRSLDDPQTPVLGYPKFDDRVDEYETFTGKQLNEFIDAAVHYFMDHGLKPNAKKVIGILAPCDVSFVVTFFALSRLGYTVLCLSLRIAPVAIANLIRQTDCAAIVHGENPQIWSNLTALAHEHDPLDLVPIPSRDVWGVPSPDSTVTRDPFKRLFDRDAETHEVGVILHSSGSTGLPKSVSIKHAALLGYAMQGVGMHNFGALPWYHAFGLGTALQTMCGGKTANLVSATVPMTAQNLVSAIGAIRPEVIHGVPYAFGLMAETEAGIQALKSAKLVAASGAPTPDELGNKLVAAGVNFGISFGSTEAAMLGDTMRRPPGDNVWAYVRIYPRIRNSIHMEPLGDGSFECIYLKSHPGLSMSNSDFPEPGSYRSRDVFLPHPTIPDAWKYVTRLDDRVTLINGEKVLPLPIEGRIHQDELVREAVVFGIGKPIPGLLLFRAEKKEAAMLGHDDFLDKVWPSITDANASAEAFSQITREMVLVLPPGTDYPRTDKGSIIRAQVYRQFAEQIEDMYTRLERETSGTLRLDLVGIETFLMDMYKEMICQELNDSQTDFFTAGVDSLQAIQMRRKIQQTLDLGGHQLSHNAVYEQGTVASLAKHLFDLSQNQLAQTQDDTALMEDLISRYSEFDRGDVAILTGGTGSLGAHLLAQMARSPKFQKIYCLVRGNNPMRRILESLSERGLVLDEESKSKIVAWTAEVHEINLGLGSERKELLRRQVGCIIHLAWPVNFNIGLASFEPHLKGLQNLLSLSMSTKPGPARFFFASSVSTAMRTPGPALIPDGPIGSLAQASPMGYAQSKLVAEHIVLNAARKGAHAYIFRIGQIVGDIEHGVWNDIEFVPSIIRSALSLGVLPNLNEECSWIPVNTLATAILEIDQTVKESGQKHENLEQHVFYNMVNPRTFEWEEALQKLRDTGLKFKTVGVEDWVRKLQEAARLNDRNEEVRNPAVKLIHQIELRYLNNDFTSTGHVRFDTKALERDSQALRSPPDIIGEGYIQKFVSSWMKKWQPAMSVEADASAP